MQTLRNNLQSMESCSKLVGEDHSQILENEEILRKDVRTEEKESARESISYPGKNVNVPERQVNMCVKKKRIQLQTTENGRKLQTMTMSFFGSLESRVRQRVLQPSANQVF